MKFLQQKEQFLSKPDKSGIGGIDKAIRNLVDMINTNSGYYTTSSCAGRIILMVETGKKQESVFVFETHEKADVDEIKTALQHDKRARKAEMIYLKEEPCILHVACKTAKDADRLVNIARQSGWKKSGIISLKEGKVMVEMLSTERLEAPIMKKGKMTIHDDYLKILIDESNKKLKQTRQKIKNLEKAIIKSCN